MSIKKTIFCLLPILPAFFLFNCNRAAQNTTETPRHSLAESLEQSFSQSSTGEKSRKISAEQMKKLQASQQKLQEDRLKSYSDTSSFGQNP